MKKQGLVQVYTGSGKNKTTSAFGLTFRAMGKGWNVLIVQFLKGDDSTDYGEVTACEKFVDQITVIQSHNKKKIVMEHNKDKEDTLQVQEAWTKMTTELYQGKASCKKIILSEDYEGGFTTEYKPYDMLVMDEVLVALCLELLTQKQFFSFISLLRKDNPDLELVLTGRMWNDSIYDKIKDIADLMTDGRCVKHYFDKHCTVCKRSFEYRSNYCPNCGGVLVTTPARDGIEF